MQKTTTSTPPFQSMLLTCTPGQLVSFLIGKLAVSDGLPLPELWHYAASKSTTGAIDEFQKSVIWAALTNAAGSLVHVSVSGSVHPLTPSLPLASLLADNSELDIVIVASAECQCTYLTSSENYDAIKTALGDLPFRLLIVIARHGPDGVLNADLARESGQDIRSLRLRLQKLELAGFIVTRSVYVDKKHTTHSVHAKFVSPTASVASESQTAAAEAEDDLSASRDVSRVKRHIMDALKQAPNHLRGFSDLRKELKLDGSISASKFFRSICLKLHKGGFVEKLTVENPETAHRLYAIRFIKDFPKDAEVLSNDMDIVNDLEDLFEAEGGVDNPEEDFSFPATLPALNRVFPIFTQLFHQINSAKEKGVVSGEVFKNLLGISDYRPYARLLEVLPSYLSNGVTLKSSKKLPDPYEKYTVSKLYDNEGKVKFYRYKALEFCNETKPKAKIARPSGGSTKSSLVGLNKKLHVSVGTLANDTLRAKKDRLILRNNTSSSKLQSQSQRMAKRTSAQSPGGSGLDTAAVLEPRKRRRTKPVSYTIDDTLMDVDAGVEDDYTPEMEGGADVEAETVSADVENRRKKPVVLSSGDLPQFVAAPKDNTKRKQTLTAPVKNEGSAKSMARRSLLVVIIKEEGGATFSSLSLCKKLDQRMGNSTLTDVKTLARDVVHLSKSGVLDIQRVPVELGGQTVEKKLLVLKSEENQPSPERLQQLQESYADLRSKKDMKMFQKRLIQSDVKLYVEKPSAKQLIAAQRRRRKGANRLQAIGDDEDGRESSSVKDEPTDGPSDSPQDVFSQIKKSKRAKKATTSSSSQSTLVAGKKARRNIKLEKSDATLLYRAVVISKAFSRDAIDFDKIAENFPHLDGKLVKQKWGTLRRSFGGAGAVSQGVETFQKMVMAGIEDGTITESHLSSGSLKFFLDYWRDYDTGTEPEIKETMPLYASYHRNEQEYVITRQQQSDTVTLLSDKIEDISMRQKESILGQVMFVADTLEMPIAKKHERLRQTLKSMFSTRQEKADPVLVKKILEQFGEASVKEATDHLMKDKELFFVYLENNAETKFVLSDRFSATLHTRVFTPRMFHRAAFFNESLVALTRGRKGLVLSQGVMPGDMAALLEMISAGEAELVRIDRAFKFENYESRLIDKESIACDLVVTCLDTNVDSKKISPVNIPYEGPCYPIWIDANSDVNKSLWTKLLLNLLYYVVFKPGIPEKVLFEKLNPVLGVDEFNRVMQWLVDSGCVRRYSSGGFRATDRWQYLLGLPTHDQV